MSAHQTWFGRSMARPRSSQYLMPRCRLADARLRAERRNAHLTHQPPNALAIAGTTLSPQHRRHPPRAEERSSGKQLVDPPHQPEIVVIAAEGGR
jgi:hypothetical protein